MYQGTIIEESLENKDVLQKIKIVSTNVEQVTERHKTPWIFQWTLHSVALPEAEAEAIAIELSKSLDGNHAWYVDFKNETHHYIIFRDKVFSIDRTSQEQYDEAMRYGVSVGIPDYQLDFAPRHAVLEEGAAEIVKSEPEPNAAALEYVPVERLMASAAPGHAQPGVHVQSKKWLFRVGLAIAILNPVFSGVILGAYLFHEPELKREGKIILSVAVAWGVMVFLLAFWYRRMERFYGV